MKKPNITPGEWRVEKGGNWCRVISDHDFLHTHDIVSQDSGIQDAKAISAVPEMIDALIECHELLTVQHKFEDDENMQKVLSHNIDNVEKALTKAGVQL